MARLHGKLVALLGKAVQGGVGAWVIAVLTGGLHLCKTTWAGREVGRKGEGAGEHLRRLLLSSSLRRGLSGAVEPALRFPRDPLRSRIGAGEVNLLFGFSGRLVSTALS